MKRLLLVAALLTEAAGCATTSHSAPASIPPVRIRGAELSASQQIDHALRRLSYGARPGDAENVAAMGLDVWIARQLRPATITDTHTDSLLLGFTSLALPSSEITEMFREVRAARRDTSKGSPDVKDDRRRLQRSLAEVGQAKLLRAVTSERQLYEQMVDFWENHFSVFAGKGQTRLFIPAYDRDVIRPHAMGKFRELLGAVAKSPAMLFYLDNARSTSRGLNENYARELMELHTLGVDGGYTQNDVGEVARALTGWSIDPRAGAFVFRPRMHDASPKLVLGKRIDAGGIRDGEEVLDLLARHPATARHITSKLIKRFVSDSVPVALRDRCADVFGRSDGDIAATLQCVVTSPEFFSKAAYRAKVKTPFELVASALRATGSEPAGPRSPQLVARLGQPSFGRQTPDGWPETADEWVNAGAMINRTNFLLALAGGNVPGIRVGTVDSRIAATLTSPEFQKR